MATRTSYLRPVGWDVDADGEFRVFRDSETDELYALDPDYPGLLAAVLWDPEESVAHIIHKASSQPRA